MKQGLVWLASYPRSGNTLLRTLLWQCLGLKSGSVYRDDLGDNPALQEAVGHVEQAADGRIHFPAANQQLALVKTHGYPRDAAPAIYVIRDGRAACASLWQFYEGEVSMADVAAGHHRFRSWGEHVAAWDPWSRPDTLFLRYEDMVADVPGTLQQLSVFLQREIVQHSLPSREAMAQADGTWVRSASSWQDTFNGEPLRAFEAQHRALLQRAGYLDAESL